MAVQWSTAGDMGLIPGWGTKIPHGVGTAKKKKKKKVLKSCVCAHISSCAHANSCLTLCNPMDYSPPGSSDHGISQTRILEWVAISSSKESSRPRDQTHISCVSCIGRWILYHWATREAPYKLYFPTFIQVFSLRENPLLCFTDFFIINSDVPTSLARFSCSWLKFLKSQTFLCYQTDHSSFQHLFPLTVFSLSHEILHN